MSLLPTPLGEPASGGDASQRSPLRVLFFGTASTEPGKPRPRVLLRGLRENAAVVDECRAALWAYEGDRLQAARSLFSLRNVLTVARAELTLARRYVGATGHDVVFVGPEGHLDIILLRLLQLIAGFRPVVFDPFISLADTIVEDRRLLSAGSLGSRVLRALDRFACRLADAVLVDTEAMRQHYITDLGVSPEKLSRIFVGEEEALYSPEGDEPPPEPPSTPLRVLWFGTHIALHGVPVIVDAAAQLAADNLHFTIIGVGQELPAVEVRARTLSNVTVLPTLLTAAELRAHLEASHVALGIFGTTAKAQRVIPCKVFDILSAGRALVTADTPAVRELIEPNRHAVLVPPGDAAALAEALRGLRDEPARRVSLARAGLRLYRERCTPRVLGAELLRILEKAAGRE